jgi:hypothetical protein
MPHINIYSNTYLSTTKYSDEFQNCHSMNASVKLILELLFRIVVEEYKLQNGSREEQKQVHGKEVLVQNNISKM